MKKFFWFLFVVIVIAVGAVLIIGFFEPKDVTVKRSIAINAPRDTVLRQVTRFANWHNWGVWFRLDSTMKVTYDGDDGQAGSSYHWVGDENKVGEGTMQCNSTSGTGIVYEMHIVKPMAMDAGGSITVSPDGNKEQVTWAMTKHSNYPWNAMWMFVDLDKLLGSDLENSLAYLKIYAEAHTEPPIDVTEVDYPAQVYMGMRQSLFWLDLGKLLTPETYRRLGSSIGDNVSGPAVALFYSWDTLTRRTTVAAAFPVTDSNLEVKGADMFRSAACKALKAVEKGGYGKLGAVHGAIKSYAASKGVATGLMIEEYQVGPLQETDTNKWVTNIYYLEK